MFNLVMTRDICLTVEIVTLISNSQFVVHLIVDMYSWTLWKTYNIINWVAESRSTMVEEEKNLYEKNPKNKYLSFIILSRGKNSSQ